jgi:hypothetical protein
MDTRLKSATIDDCGSAWHTCRIDDDLYFQGAEADPDGAAEENVVASDGAAGHCRLGR